MSDEPPIKAIETRYNGYHFRSRLEARWAVFFDTLGITYEYEPQGYELPSGQKYLPDFYLPELDVYFEVKGARPALDAPDFRRWEEFATGVSEDDYLPLKAVIAWGSIPAPSDISAFGQANYGQGVFDDVPFGMACHWRNYTWVWTTCAACGFPQLVTSYAVGGSGGCCQRCARETSNFDGNAEKVVAAYAAARSARFEHGQSGA